MSKKLLVAGAAFAVFAVAGLAAADEATPTPTPTPAPTPAAPAVASVAGGKLGSAPIIISAERIWGFQMEQIKSTDDKDNESTDSFTSFNLLWNSSQTVNSVPRWAFDYNMNGITLGGSLGFLMSSSKTEQKAGGASVSADGPKQTVFAIAPRAGYLLPLGDMLYLWGRLGVTYFNSSSERETTGPTGTKTKSTTSLNGLVLNVEPTLVVQPFPHMGITAGINFDFPLSGKAKTESGGVTGPETTVKQMAIGLNFGILVHF